MTEETEKKEYKNNDIKIGMWKATSKKGTAYVKGRSTKFWIHYYPNQDPTKLRGDEVGSLVLYPKEEFEDDFSRVTILMYKKTYKDKKTGDDVAYLNGSRGKTFTIFTNTRKASSKSPDYNLIIGEQTNKEKYAIKDTESDLTSIPVSPMPKKEELLKMAGIDTDDIPNPEEDDDIPGDFTKVDDIEDVNL